MGSNDILSSDDVSTSVSTESANASVVRSPVTSEVVSRGSPELYVSSIDSRRSSSVDTNETGGKSTCSPGLAHVLQPSVLNNVLLEHASKNHYPLRIPKTSARVLTSEEHLLIMEEKEKKRKKNRKQKRGIKQKGKGKK